MDVGRISSGTERSPSLLVLLLASVSAVVLLTGVVTAVNRTGDGAVAVGAPTTQPSGGPVGTEGPPVDDGFNGYEAPVDVIDTDDPIALEGPTSSPPPTTPPPATVASATTVQRLRPVAGPTTPTVPGPTNGPVATTATTTSPGGTATTGPPSPTTVTPKPTPTTGQTATTTAPTTATTVPPTTAPATTTTAPRAGSMGGRIGVYQAGAMDVYTVGADGAPTFSIRQTGLQPHWTLVTGIGNDLVNFYEPSGGNVIGRMLPGGPVVDISSGPPDMGAGFTAAADLELGSGRVFYYRRTDGHSGSILAEADGQIREPSGYRVDLPSGYDLVAAVGGGRAVVYRSSDGDGIVVEPRAGGVLVRLGHVSLPAGLTALGATGNGLVVGLKGDGTGVVLRFEGVGVLALRGLNVGGVYRRAMPLPGGVVLHDPPSGRLLLLKIDTAGRVVASTAATTPPNSIVAAVT